MLHGRVDVSINARKELKWKRVDVDALGAVRKGQNGQDAKKEAPKRLPAVKQNAQLFDSQAFVS
jgi:hypothetical protein